MDRIYRYKLKYGDGEVKCDNEGHCSLPKWLYMIFLDNAGCKSKKRRQRNKIIKREFHKAMWRGISNDMNLNEKDREWARSKTKEPTR